MCVDAHVQAVLSRLTTAFAAEHILHAVKPADPLNPLSIHASQFELVKPRPAAHVHCVEIPVVPITGVKVDGQVQGLDDEVVVAGDVHCSHVVELVTIDPALHTVQAPLRL